MSRSVILMRRNLPLQIGGGAYGDIFQGIEYQRGHGQFQGIEFQRGHGHFCRCRNNYQRGDGWGWIGSLFRKAAPLLMKGAKTVGKQLLSTAGEQAINTGIGFLNDVVDGENVVESAKPRLKQGGNQFMNTAKTQIQEDGKHLAKIVKRKLEDLQQQQGFVEGSLHEGAMTVGRSPDGDR